MNIVHCEISFCISHLLQLSNLSEMPIDKAGESNEGTGGRVGGLVEKGEIAPKPCFYQWNLQTKLTLIDCTPNECTG